ncbi:MAG: ABC transporter permease [Desulfobacterales bacterium]
MRAIAVLVGIAMGAAVFTSVRLSVRASLDAFSRSVNLLAGTSDLVASTPGGRVPETLVADLIGQSSVAAVSPFSSIYVRQNAKDAKAFLLVGIDPVLDREFREWQAAADAGGGGAAWVDLMTQPFTILAGSELAEENGWRTGDLVSLVHARQEAVFRIIGILETHGLGLADGGRIAIADMATFQEFTGTVGVLDRVDIRVLPATGDDAADAIEESLPGGIRVSTASTARESGRSMIRAYQLNLSVLSFVSLFVGMFLVYSLVALNAASRRREIAVLRSVGASSRTVFLLFLSEGGLYGLAGWCLAIPLGGVLVPYLLNAVGRTISSLFVRVTVAGGDLNGWEIALSFLVTTGVSLLAAFQPAREAMAVTPREAMGSLPAERIRASTPGRLAVAGALCIVLVWPLSELPGPSGVPLPGYFATLLLFGGFSLLAPWGLREAGNLLGPVIGRVGGIPAFLAGRYLRDTGTRTAISVGALITAVALYTALVIMIHSFRGTVELWVGQTVSGDLFLTTRNAEINQQWEPFDAYEMDGLSDIAGSAGADLVADRRISLDQGSMSFMMDFLDLEAFSRHGGFMWIEGDPETALPAVIQGKGVIVSEVFANRSGRSVGQSFEAQIAGVRIDLPILGIVRDYRTRGGVVFGDLHALGEAFGGLRWGGARFFLREPASDPSRAAAELRTRIADRFGGRFDMMSGQSLRGAVLRIFDETFAVTGVLLMIALAVAALGITTTMTVLVLERTRELNTLLAVGGSRGQVRRMILWETVLMVTAGQIGGLLCGFVLSYLLVFVINRQSFGWTFLYAVDWGAIALSAPLILAAALAAAMPAVGIAYRQSPALLLRE